MIFRSFSIYFLLTIMRKKIFIVEGIWRSGKTTFIDNINNLAHIHIIPEPSHLEFNIPNSQHIRDRWYARAHLHNFRQAINFSDNNIIFLERAVISSIAFRKAYIKKNDYIITDIYHKFINELISLRENNVEVNVIMLSLSNINHCLNHLNQHTFLKIFNHKNCLLSYQIYIYNEISKLAQKDIIIPIYNPSIEDILSIIKNNE